MEGRQMDHTERRSVYLADADSPLLSYTPKPMMDERLDTLLNEYVESVANEKYPKLTSMDIDIIERKHLVLPFTTTKNLLMYSIVCLLSTMAFGSIFTFPPVTVGIIMALFIGGPLLVLLYQSERTDEEVRNMDLEISDERRHYSSQTRLYMELAIRKGRDPEDIIRMVEKDLPKGTSGI